MYLSNNFKHHIPISTEILLMKDKVNLQHIKEGIFTEERIILIILYCVRIQCLFYQNPKILSDLVSYISH